MIIDLLWLTAMLCWLLALVILYRHGPRVWLVSVILAIAWVVWRFALTLPAVAQEDDRAELADHMTISGKAYGDFVPVDGHTSQDVLDRLRAMLEVK